VFGIELELSEGLEDLITIERSSLSACCSSAPLFDLNAFQDGFDRVFGEGEGEFSSQIGSKPSVSESSPFSLRPVVRLELTRS